MEIDIVPEIVPDFTLWGKPDFFNFDDVRNVVQISWPNGVRLELPKRVFDKLKFSIPDHKVAISKISALRTDEFERLRGVFGALEGRMIEQRAEERLSHPRLPGLPKSK